jgi:hypothetical protein
MDNPHPNPERCHQAKPAESIPNAGDTPPGCVPSSTSPILSHRYEFTRSDVARVVGGPLLALALLAAGIHAAAALHLLPGPRPMLDMDRTILVHQAAASRNPGSARIVLAGDSSCLMDVAARDLESAWQQPVLNLATLSYVDLPTTGRLLAQCARSNPAGLETVVLLVHPDTLRLQGSSPYHNAQILAFLEGKDPPAGTDLDARFAAWTGADLCRNRVLGRWLPFPLPGEYGRFYGFTLDLAQSLTVNAGSAVDPHTFNRATTHGSTEYRLARRFESDSRQLRLALPPGVRLLVGLTPVPASFAAPGHADAIARIRSQWAGWLRADGVLSNLPGILPDGDFASVTHLTAKGQRQFTARLAEEAGPLIVAPNPTRKVK